MGKTIDFLGYKVTDEGSRVIVENVKDFNPVHTFECGQCFRWIKQPDGSFTGVAKGRVVNVDFRDGAMQIDNTSLEDFKDIWFEYFDLGRDYSAIKEKLAEDPIMAEAVEFGYGIRLLKQDLWETLISFIISANNRIPMIMKVVAAISKMYGGELEYKGEKYYTFPGMDKLADSCVEELELCRAGFRCEYIVKSSRMVKEGTVDLAGLSSMTTDEARSELVKLAGVGNKVADCTLLYSGTKYDVFPTDVWVKRVMEELYFKRPASLKEIQEFAKAKFGGNAGIAQQYLFYYAREKGIGAKGK